MWQLYRAKEIWEQNGPIQLLKSAVGYITKQINKGVSRLKESNYVPFVGSDTYSDQRIDNEYRWSVIQPYIQDYTSCLDIGCAEGYFTHRAAEEGLYSIGIDNNSARLSNAFDRGRFQSNVGYLNWEITPQTISLLPDTNVVLLLTVYHHFIAQYGDQTAEQMLRELSRKSELLVCELPGHRWAGLPLTMKARNTKTDEEYEIDLGSIPKFDVEFPRQLEPGEYQIVIEAPGYGTSDETFITVGRSGKVLEGKLQVLVEKGKLQIYCGKNGALDIELLTAWYKRNLTDCIGDDIEILESTPTDYKGGTRRDILFVINTENIT